jgi:hypothetical protein
MKTLTHPSNWPTVDASGKTKTAQAVIFGLGSMFNHSTKEQNVGWVRDTNRQIITYRALRDIAAGEELCKQSPAWVAVTLRWSILLTIAGISYGSRLTFKDTDASPPTPPEEEIEQLRMIQPY